MKQREGWIRTDEASDLLNSLEHCWHCLRLAEEDTRNWKWALGASHSAAQIAMAKVLIDEGNDQHWTDKSRKAFWKWLEDSRANPSLPSPKTRLKEFLVLYEDVKRFMPTGAVTPEMDRDMGRLGRTRNEWTHFGETSMSVEVAYARIATRVGIEVVSLLPLDTERLYSSRKDAKRHGELVDELLTSLARA